MTTDSRRRLVLSAYFAVASAFAAAALFPYLLALTPEIREHFKAPLAVMVIAQAVQCGVFLFAMSWVGLRLGASLGLGSPLLEQRAPPKWTSLLIAAGAGLATGALILALDAAFARVMPPAAQPLQAIAWWKGLLASFYGGIVEEIELRLFLMTLIAWLLSRVARGSGVMIAAVLIAALAFGAGHLPTAAKLWPLTAIVVTRTIALNALGGIVFGVFYWKRGFEHAMVAHFCGDLVLHVVT